ncbi:hypothetical protein PAPYR_8297 [Paratrimastix pyriformis]|uniref:Uncharacterized protein n=1 Tax=Paratrimastix pyriformis TaxID=342808 RepID=A0ABQ8UGD8_9EUKA|nr:hypothetical protein PAPYR_8297 [Paratrimastix pyriformis]
MSGYSQSAGSLRSRWLAGDIHLREQGNLVAVAQRKSARLKIVRALVATFSPTATAIVDVSGWTGHEWRVVALVLSLRTLRAVSPMSIIQPRLVSALPPRALGELSMLLDSIDLPNTPPRSE